MKNKQIFVVLVVTLLVIGSASLVMAQEPELDGANLSHAGAGLKVITNNSQKILVELTIDDYQFETITHNGQTYQRLNVLETVQSTKIGKPQLPILGTWLGVPTTNDVSVKIVETESEILTGYPLYPAPATKIVGQGLQQYAQEVFALDEQTYNTDAFYPNESEIATLGDTGKIREQAVAQLQFYAAQHNPLTGETRLYTRILVEITWDGSARTAQEQTVSPAYDSMYKNILLNYDELNLQTAQPAPQGRANVEAQQTSKTVKISVENNGIYNVSYESLTTAGLDLSGATPTNIKMTHLGQTVDIQVISADGSTFKAGDSILFYGQAIESIYTTQNVYLLTVGEAGQPMSSRDGAPQGGTVPTEFPIEAHFEEDTDNYRTIPDGEGKDHWFWGGLIAPNTSQLSPSRDYKVTLKNISNTATSATVRVQVYGKDTDQTLAVDKPNHNTKISLNGSEVDNQTWRGNIFYTHTVEIDHSKLTEGENTIKVETPGGTEASIESVYINWIEIDYFGTYKADNNQLFFNAPNAGSFQFEVTGFSGDNVDLFDITDPNKVARITGGTVTDGKLQFQDTAQDTEYLALTSARYQTPSNIELDEVSTLKSDNSYADYIIISHKDFLTDAERLAEYHRDAFTRTVRVVKIDDVYDEFSNSIFTPQAIRDFLTYAYENWKDSSNNRPDYVLLLGDGIDDYRKLLSQSKDMTNYIPPQLIEIAGEIDNGQTPSDNWFVEVSGNDVLPDMMIGRLPAQSSTEAKTMVDKIINYKTTDAWQKNVLLISDDGNDGKETLPNPIFDAVSERLASAIPHYYTANKVYFTQYSDSSTTTPKQDINKHINNGTLLINYAGHGAITAWGLWDFNSVFQSSDIDSLSNGDKLPLVTVANCLSGFFSSVKQTDSMAETFLRADNKGAVAVWAPSWLDFPSGHRTLIGGFYNNFFEDDTYPIGQAADEAKLALYGKNQDWKTLVQTFILFGDPAMPLGVATNYPYVDYTYPESGTTGISLDENIEVSFSKPVLRESVKIEVQGATNLTFTPEWDNDDKFVEYTVSTTSRNFVASQTITVTISGATDKLGNQMGVGSVPSTWSFTTLSGNETYLPTVVK
ncbi:C25 family cysteine peptidase [Anaerolineales bacterium HSG25]|nr:C25 family cysteine peptidase [Anaerolineales bacterium HSG25]